MRRKALPLDYYYDMDPPPNVGPTPDPFRSTNDSEAVVVTVAPMGNGRIREASDSIPEEPADDSPQHNHGQLPFYSHSFLLDS